MAQRRSHDPTNHGDEGDRSTHRLLLRIALQLDDEVARLLLRAARMAQLAARVVQLEIDGACARARRTGGQSWECRRAGASATRTVRVDCLRQRLRGDLAEAARVDVLVVRIHPQLAPSLARARRGNRGIPTGLVDVVPDIEHVRVTVIRRRFASHDDPVPAAHRVHEHSNGISMPAPSGERGREGGPRVRLTSA